MNYTLYLIKLAKNEETLQDDIIGRTKFRYSSDMSQDDIYDAIRGYWEISDTSFKEADFFLGLTPEDDSGTRFKIAMEIRHYKDSLTTVTEDESNASGGRIKPGTKYFEGNRTTDETKSETNLVGKIVQFDFPSENRKLIITSDELEQFIVED
mgnify:CR=1 FL=1